MSESTHMSSRFLALLLFLFLISYQANSYIVPLPPGFSPTNKNTSITDQRNHLLNLVNGVRTSLGRSILYLDTTLNNLAGNHSLDMVTNKFFSHTNLAGLSPQARATRIGFMYGVGQNIAYMSGFNLTQLHVNLMNSPPHYNNTIKPEWTRVGFGVAFNSTQTYLTVVFSSRDFTNYPLTAAEKNQLLGSLKSSIQQTNTFTNSTPFWPQLSISIEAYMGQPQSVSIFTYLSRNFGFLSIESKTTLNPYSPTLIDSVKGSFTVSRKYARYGIGINVSKQNGNVKITVVFITPK